MAWGTSPTRAIDFLPVTRRIPSNCLLL
jgi:hypothetical protein